MSSFRIFTPDQVWVIGERTLIEGDEARHAARVRRVREGERVELLNGRGGIAEGIVREVRRIDRGGAGVLVEVTGTRNVAPQDVRIEVCTPVPGPGGEHIGVIVDQLSQVGAWAWRPLRTARSVASKVRRDRLERIAVESAKQCGRAWTLAIGDEIDIARACDGGALVVLADGGGAGVPELGALAPGVVRLLVGPEGGWTDEERAGVLARGGRAVCFGPHVMRIGTAAVAATVRLVGAPRRA